MKTFDTAFNTLLDKISKKENFAFTRFSDGELFIMQNKTVILAKDHYVTGDIKGPNIYTKEEQKEFLPERTDAHVGTENFKYMIDLHEGDHPNLTFSNLLINANYRRFVEEMIPLFQDREIIYIVNENADISRLPFDIKKTFEIGANCMINDYETAEKVKSYINENDIKNHIVLCSAASLSNYVIYECFKDNQNNTFLDIGSCLNPLLELEGWKYTRGYLTHYWLGKNSNFGTQVDVWQAID